MQTLIQKASTKGLSEAEAEELGRLYAEAAGRVYSNAADERAARDARRTGIVHQERALRRRRWPLRALDARVYTKARSLEIGQTASPPEDADRAA